MRLTEKQLKDMFGKEKANKFGAKKTTYNGHTFHSKKEAERAFELDCLKKIGEIKKIEYQPVFDIIVEGKKICKYIADFRITYADGSVTVEDVKGYKGGTAYYVFTLKKKLVEALYDIKIIEV